MSVKKAFTLRILSDADEGALRLLESASNERTRSKAIWEAIHGWPSLRKANRRQQERIHALEEALRDLLARRAETSDASRREAESHERAQGLVGPSRRRSGPDAWYD